MPTSTDLVTDLPADFEVFGQAVDTDFVDLLGGTTGQVLSKTTNTDLDFTWVTPQVGDITAVNVTAPITGGGSSGAVTIGVSAASTAAAGVVQLSDSTSTTSSVLASTPTATKSAYDLADAAIPKSTVTTNGDIIYATGSAAVTRLGIGSTGQVLKVAGGVPSWAADSGKVLQVIMGTTSTAASNSTTTYADTNLTATITPSSATSKVLVLVSQCGVVRSNGNANNALLLQLQRAGSSIAQISNEGMQTDTALRQGDFTYNINYLDSPATTSATTYKTQFKNKQASASIQVQAASELSTIILMEIGA